MVEPCFLVKLGPFACWCLNSHQDSDAHDFVVWRGSKATKKDDVPPVRPRLVRKPSGSALTLARRLSHGLPNGKLDKPEMEAILDNDDHEDDELDIDIDDVEEVRALSAAVRVGRYVEAHRELQRLKVAGIDPKDILPAVVVERIERIASKYEYSLGVILAEVRDLQTYEVNPKLRMEWGLELKGGVLHIIYLIEEPDLDIVSSFAALQERDLHLAFNKGLVKVDPMGEQTPHDTYWRAFNFSKTTNTKGDNVTLSSAVDALDEPTLNALWFGTYTPSAATAELHGVKIPPPEPDHVRSEYTFQVCTLTPARGTGDRTRGFTMKVVVEQELPAVVQGAVYFMPSMFLKRLARSKVEQMPKDFANFVRNSTALQERMQSSSRAGFYKYLRERLQGTSPR
mmetsp:Transcript_84266/g.235156  ORF Transcript_84266/g.235156 Transcript_84266/m.235156 type:complete len:398 (-) Transcript_84266:113-1306(-)